jgi:glutathione S-transferase
MRLYNSAVSGNCYKVRLLLAHLGIDYECVDIDHKTDLAKRPSDFLERHPTGRVPLLELDDGTRLAESNAILAYLAEGTPYLPDDRLARARVLQWMFFEQNNHEPSIATRRNWVFLRKEPEKRRDQLALWLANGLAALGTMERHLAQDDFFGPEGYSIADIALYGYTHCADEGGFELDRFPSVLAWLERVRQQPGHVPML